MTSVLLSLAAVSTNLQDSSTEATSNITDLSSHGDTPVNTDNLDV